MISADIPVLGFAAYSGTGKTTLLVQLIPLLQQKGVRIGMIKHAHHQFDIDQPGKDSYQLRKAGACQMLIASRQRWALITEREGDQDPELRDMIARLDQKRLDMILVEGFKHESFPKIVLHRQQTGHPLPLGEDDSIIAIACDAELDTEVTVPVLDINDPEQIAEFILATFPLVKDHTGNTP